MSARTQTDSQPLLRARGIVNRFGSQTVHDGIDLDVLPGEILGIAGGSGTGKSVLLKTLIGLHRPDAGEVSIDGKRIGDIGPEEKAALIGVAFQQGALFSSLTVAQNIMLPIRLHTDLPQAEREKIAVMKLEMTGLSAATGAKFPGELSGGMVKRAAFARALALDPRLLFLDEPTSDLDPLAAGGIDELIQQVNRHLGITVVLVTHDLNTLFAVCSRVAILVEGRLTIGTLDELLESKQAWIRDFLHGPRAQRAANARNAHHGNR
jgi:phospholipid/cholesterol/gamma-HCH transport system ATP-binding protein